MPILFTKDQIRLYLQEMGYDELDGTHLDHFIKDLKKLIRNEEKKRKENILRESGRIGSSADQPIYESSMSESYDRKSETNVSSKKLGTENIRSSADQPIYESSMSESYDRKSETNVSSKKLGTENIRSSADQPIYESSMSESYDRKSETNFSSKKLETENMRKYNGRTDPVSLYHFYRCLWNKQKAPGEDRHMQLRWNVRAGTMGKIPCDPCGRKINYLTVGEKRNVSEGPSKEVRRRFCLSQN